MWQKIKLWQANRRKAKMEKDLRRMVLRAKNVWYSVEKYMLMAGLPKHTREQIRRDIIKGNMTFFEMRK
jgi:hypothetical protein